MSATSTAGTTIANPATVTLNIQKPFPIDTQPDSYYINEGQTLVTTANNAPLVNDDLQTFIYTSGPKGSIVKVIDPPDHAAPGGFVFPPDGVFSYTPQAGFSGTTPLQRMSYGT